MGGMQAVAGGPLWYRGQVCQPVVPPIAAVDLAPLLYPATPPPQSKRTTETSEQEGGSSQPPQPQGKQGAAAAGGCNGSGDATGNSSTQAGNGAGAALHFEVLERQINDALVRLSLSEEQVAASLRQAGGVAASGAAPTQQVPRQMLPGELGGAV